MPDASSLPPLFPLTLGPSQQIIRKKRVFERYSCEYKPQDSVQAEVASFHSEESAGAQGLRFTVSRVGKYFRLFIWPTDEELQLPQGVVLRAKLRSAVGGQAVLWGSAKFEEGSGWNWSGAHAKKLTLSTDWSSISVRFGGAGSESPSAFMIQVASELTLDIAQLTVLPIAGVSTAVAEQEVETSEGEQAGALHSDLMLQHVEASHGDNTLRVTAYFLSQSGKNLAGVAMDVLAASLVVQRRKLKAAADDSFVFHFQAPCSSRTAAMPLSLTTVDRREGWPIAIAQNAWGVGAQKSQVRRPPAVLTVAGAVEGDLNGLSSTLSGAVVLEGWARDPQEPGSAVTVDLKINELPFGTAYCTDNRDDVEELHEGSRVCGYRLELPHNFCCGETLQAEVIARSQGSEVPTFRQSFQMAPFGELLPAVSGSQGQPMAVPLELTTRAPAASLSQTYAAVVLTQNGADVLCDLLASIVAFESATFDSIVIIDHESTDNTPAIVERFARRLPLRVFTRPASSSFSESNNFGAAQCEQDVLVFLNNDIEFIEPAIELMGSQLAPGVGMVGVKLLDPSPPGANSSRRAPQHVGVHLSHHGSGKLRPFESRLLTAAPDANHQVLETPLVTAALSLMDRRFFEELGGFNEAYFYGWEDSDLCLRALQCDRVNLCVNTASVVHVRGYSRRTMPRHLATRRGQNAQVFREKWSYPLLRRLRRGLTDNLGYWTGRQLNIGFVVSEVGEQATAGDTMTALEFARAFTQRTPSKAFFFDKREPVNAQEIDVLVVMTDDFDVRTVSNLGLASLVVAWARNWFQRWAVCPWRERFDVWFASSDLSADYLMQELGRPVTVLRLATNGQRFHPEVAPNEFYRSDVSFTGSFGGIPRDITGRLGSPNYDFRVFGSGWEEVPELHPYLAEALPYQAMPEVYRSTQIVLDDSNFATACWASLNSRIFDALACGTLVLTNNEAGSKELFGGLLPSYSDATSLQQLVERYLRNPVARQELVEKLRAQVMASETYEQRAGSFLQALQRRAVAGLSIAIKLAVPSIDHVESWGDWHFASSLRRELEALGHSVRLDCMEDWKGEHTQRDDACIVLRGLERYTPRPEQLNLMWLISHPDKISAEELEQYDEVYVASRPFSEQLRKNCQVPIFFLPQCTDEKIFYPPAPSTARSGVVFVANSRLVMRPVAQAAVDAGVDVSVYGTRWKGLLPKAMVRAETVTNLRVGELYRGANIVLNDHWDDMKRRGFISNRLFDAVACGAVVLSDEVSGLDELLPGAVITFSDSEDFQNQMQAIEQQFPCEKARLAAAQAVLELHSFGARALQLDAALRRLDASRDSLAHLDAGESLPTAGRNSAIWMRGETGRSHAKESLASLLQSGNK